jgi:hypothetical protein
MILSERPRSRPRPRPISQEPKGDTSARIRFPHRSLPAGGIASPSRGKSVLLRVEAKCGAPRPALRSRRRTGRAAAREAAVVVPLQSLPTRAPPAPWSRRIATERRAPSSESEIEPRPAPPCRRSAGGLEEEIRSSRRSSSPEVQPLPAVHRFTRPKRAGRKNARGGAWTEMRVLLRTAQWRGSQGMGRRSLLGRARRRRHPAGRRRERALVERCPMLPRDLAAAVERSSSRSCSRGRV